MKKTILIIGIIFLLVGINLGPITIGYNISKSYNQIITKEDAKQSLNTPLDSSWSMYQHDAANTGYSQATFPNSFNQIWFKSYEEDLGITLLSTFASPVSSNGKLFIPGDGDATGGDMCVLNQNNGSLIWIKKISLNPNAEMGFHGYHSPAIYKNKVFTVLGCVFTFKSRSKIVALDENTGDIIWEKSFFGTSCYSSVTVADDKVFVCGHLTFCPISWLYVFDANNGDLLWKKTLFGYIETTPVVSDNKVFVAPGRISGMAISFGLTQLLSGNSRVYAFDINNGEEIWMKRVKGYLVQCSPTISNGILFVPSNIMILNRWWICRLNALDAETGEIIWYHDMSQKLGMWPSSISTPSVAYGKVYVIDSDACLRAWDQESGDLIWEKEIYPENPDAFSNVFASPVVIDEKVIVMATDYYLNSNNELFMFNESNGEYIWSLKFDGGSFNPFIVSNEMIFVNDGWNGIFAFR